MICPFCLQDVRFSKKTTQKGALSYVCPIDTCAQFIPRLYVDDYKKFPPVVVSVIGHRAHGKTVALSTLYYALSRMDMGNYWPDFYLFPINEPSLEVVFENAKSLDAGKLPPPNPKIFPEPTLIQVNSLPITEQGRATLLFYDTAGEAFLKTQDIGRYAGFVRRAKTALFLVSIPQLRNTSDPAANPASELERLLYSYIQGMADMDADTRDQHLIIVYTCADALLPELDEWPLIKQYILQDNWMSLTEPEDYIGQMYNISAQLESFTHDVLNASQFLSLANDRFKSVNYSIISALGAAPDDNGHLSVKIKPRRIMDPLFWTLERALPARKQRKLQRRLQQKSGQSLLNTQHASQKDVLPAHTNQLIQSIPKRNNNRPANRFLAFWYSLFK
ncbi:MAG: hypothetical protein AB8G77_14975 [Rhodothermales bacterium]